MEVIFNSLIESFQLENAYNIFILNHKHNANLTRYGYRFVIASSKLGLQTMFCVSSHSDCVINWTAGEVCLNQR